MSLHAFLSGFFKMLRTIATHFVTLTFLCGIVYLLSACVLSLLIYITAFCSFLYISFLLATLVDNILPRFRVNADKKAVFITGCDTGFGHLLARRLDSMGYKVFAGCLYPKSEEVKKLIDTTSNNLQVVQIDVTQDDSVQNALKVVEKSLGRNELWALVNNAGVIERGEIEWMPMESCRKQFEVNTFGVMRTTKAFLPLLRKSKGRVVTTTSTGGRVTFTGFVPYCMSKHAATSFCDGLRREMKKFGIKVITVEPVSYQTSMTDMSTVLESVKNNWNKAPEELKKDVYDANYIKAFSDATRKYNASTAKPQVHQVIDWLVEGVTVVNPHYSYIPGDARWLTSLWFVKRLPVTLADYFIRNTVTFDSDVENYLKNRVTVTKNKTS